MGKYRHNRGLLVLLNNALEQPFSQMHNYIFFYIRVIDLLQKQLDLERTKAKVLEEKAQIMKNLEKVTCRPVIASSFT
jgi:hypothetical protein